MCHSDVYEDAREKRYAALGTRTPVCSCGCGENDPFALTGTYPNILSYDCRNEADGRSVIEQQHVAGRHNRRETVAMLGNDHRVADSHKVTWPVETLRNPTGSPLLKAAASLQGWLDLLRVVIDRTVGWVPAMLEKLHDWLVAEHGPQYWVGMELGLTK